LNLLYENHIAQDIVFYLIRGEILAEEQGPFSKSFKITGWIEIGLKSFGSLALLILGIGITLEHFKESGTHLALIQQLKKSVMKDRNFSERKQTSSILGEMFKVSRVVEFGFFVVFQILETVSVERVEKEKYGTQIN